MVDLKSMIVASANGVQLSLHELLHELKVQGRLAPLIAAAVVEKVIAVAAKKESISVTDAELQRTADAFRLRQGLNRAADTQRWLANNRLTGADLELVLERNLLRQKLADKVTGDQVEKTLAANRAKLDRARLRQIIVAKEGIAQELLSRIEEEGADFTELARQHSVDPRIRASGGDLGVVARPAMAPAIEAAVFGAKNGAVVGPLKTDAGYALIKIEEITLGQLDAPTTTAIRQNLFRDWITKQIRNGPFELKMEI
jgi:parvulin-like peptidyl-prolyl isomerase